jgi:hypothetical protein
VGSWFWCTINHQHGVTEPALAQQAVAQDTVAVPGLTHNHVARQAAVTQPTGQPAVWIKASHPAR